MTIGIYMLRFTNTTKVYIGQSVNIEKRYLQHKANLVNKISNRKLNDAFSMFGLPRLEILLECSTEELDSEEDLALEIFDSVKNGFNVYQYANQAPSTNTGTGAPNAKFTKAQIIEVFELLLNNTLTFMEISNKTGVTVGVISNIACGRIHTWLSDEYPAMYNTLIQQIGDRNRGSVSEKLSAKAKGITYPSIKSPEGVKYTIDNAYKFARSMGLAGNHLTEVLNGHRKSHKGWKLCQDVLV